MTGANAREISNAETRSAEISGPEAGGPEVAGAADSQEFARLAAVIARQRRELDQAAAAATARSVVDLARGVLMERLGYSPDQAQDQLAYLSAESGTSVTELAAQITSQQLTSGHVTSDQPAGAQVASAQAEPRPGTQAEPPEPVPALARAAMENAADGSGVAAAVLEEALIPVGAAAVALWLAEPDGGLELAGQAGFSARDASRWRRIHPDMGTAAQRAATEGQETWWPAGPPDGVRTPGIGRWPAAARAVLPLPGTAAPVGAIEICWPAPVTEFPGALRRQLGGLADLCGQALGRRLRGGDLAPDDRAAWAFGLLDATLESALFANAIRDGGGQLADFRIRYLSEGFADPAGRAPADLMHRPLLEVYPAAALPGGLFERAAVALGTGEPQQMSGQIISTPVVVAPAGDAMVAPVLDVRITRLYDGIVITWRRADEIDRLTAQLQQAQRLGRIGGWEENLLTGDVLWTEPAFALFGQPGDTPIPVADLPAHVLADDIATAAGFRDALLREQRETAAAFRIIRADDGSVRQLRAFAEPITDQAGTLVAVRGAYQDVSADYHTQVAFAATRDRLADTEERAEEERRLALRLQQAITPQTPEPVATPGLEVAVRYRPAGPGHLVSGDWYDAVPLPGRGDPPGRRGHRRSRHRCGHRNGGLAQLPARPGHHRGGPGRPAGLAEQRRLPPHRGHHRHRGVRAVRPGAPGAALGPRGPPAARPGPGRDRTGTRAAGRRPARRGAGCLLRGDHDRAAAR